jgi:hypothetical protein
MTYFPQAGATWFFNKQALFAKGHIFGLLASANYKSKVLLLVHLLAIQCEFRSLATIHGSPDYVSGYQQASGMR